MDALNCMILVMCTSRVLHKLKFPRIRASLPAVNMACKGKRVRSDTKAVVCNVYDYFERESKNNKKIHQGILKLKKKTVDATGLSKCAVVCYRGGRV